MKLGTGSKILESSTYLIYLTDRLFTCVHLPTRFQRVLKMVKTVHTSIRLDLNPLECFNYPPCGHPQNPSDEESADELTVVLGGNQTLPKSNVVLVGDSAHPLVVSNGSLYLHNSDFY